MTLTLSELEFIHFILDEANQYHRQHTKCFNPDIENAQDLIERERELLFNKQGSSIEQDAKRYRWLMSQTNLELRSERIHWIHEDGTKYYPKFSLAVNATGFHGIEDPDVMVDMAMELYPLKD